MPRNPLGNLRAGRISKRYDPKTGKFLGQSTGPAPTSYKGYKGAKLPDMDDVYKLIKKSNKNATNKLVHIKAYGKFYKSKDQLTWMSSAVLHLDSLEETAKDYVQSGLNTKEFADELFDLDSGETDFVVQWLVAYEG